MRRFRSKAILTGLGVIISPISYAAVIQVVEFGGNVSAGLVDRPTGGLPYANSCSDSTSFATLGNFIASIGNADDACNNVKVGSAAANSNISILSANSSGFEVSGNAGASIDYNNNDSADATGGFSFNFNVTEETSFSYDFSATENSGSEGSTAIQAILRLNGTTFTNLFDGLQGTVTLGPGYYLLSGGIQASVSIPYSGTVVPSENYANVTNFSGAFQVIPTPIPAAAWLFGSALTGLVVAGRKKPS